MIERASVSRPTSKQLECLQAALRDRSIVLSGIDKTPAISRRAINSCLEKRWLRHSHGYHSFDLGGMHTEVLITPEGRGVLETAADEASKARGQTEPPPIPRAP